MKKFLIKLTIPFSFFLLASQAYAATANIYFNDNASLNAVYLNNIGLEGYVAMSVTLNNPGVWPKHYEGPVSAAYSNGDSAHYVVEGNNTDISFNFNANTDWYTEDCNIHLVSNGDNGFTYTVTNGPYPDWARQQCETHVVGNDIYIKIVNSTFIIH